VRKICLRKFQINQRIDERFNSAINLLGSSETSARTGAIYALHELAREEEKYRKQISIVQAPCNCVFEKSAPRHCASSKFAP
jgi:hypothetical protein